MFKCQGDCSKCKRCQNIFEDKIVKDIILPADFEATIREEENYGIAFDIGSTTIVAALWDLSNGQLIDQLGANNPQRIYGADVISRISYAISEEDGENNLHLPLIMTIKSIVKTLCNKNDLFIKEISNMTFCGNTTMTLSLLNIPLSGMATFPFTPEHIHGTEFEITIDEFTIPCYALPNIGGHIGGDIVAGVLSSQIDLFNGNAILIDIGTNGEIIIKIHDKLYGFSTAAGPAFEGANIKCGMSATSGAIESLMIDGDNIKFKTINNQPPRGICGSGILSTIDQMLKNKIIDKDGRLVSYDIFSRINPYSSLKNNILEGEFILSDNIVITQNDIRELQLAKGAIKSGISILLKKVGLSSINEIGRIYLAGGFSLYTPVSTLISLGIIPDVEAEKVKILGNSALAGTSMVLLNNDAKRHCEKLSKEIKRIELSTIDNFQEEFIAALRF